MSSHSLDFPVVGVLVFCVLWGCSNSESTSATRTSPAAESTKQHQSSPTTPRGHSSPPVLPDPNNNDSRTHTTRKQSPQHPGPPADRNDAYFTTNRALEAGSDVDKLWRIHKGKIFEVGTSCDTIEDLEIDRDSKVWVLCDDRYHHLNGNKMENIPEKARGAKNIIVGQDGSVWTIIDRRILYYQNEEWNTFPPNAQIGPNELFGLLIDWQGTPWITTRGNVYHYESGSWQNFEFSPRIRFNSRRLVDFNITKMGILVKGSHFNHYLVNGGDFTRFDTNFMDTLAPRGTKGFYALNSHEKQIRFLSKSGNTTRELNYIDGRPESRNCRYGRNIRVDESDRLWFTNNFNELIVLTSQGVIPRNDE